LIFCYENGDQRNNLTKYLKRIEIFKCENKRYVGDVIEFHDKPNN